MATKTVIKLDVEKYKKKIKSFQNPVDRKTANQIGKFVADEIRNITAKGSSPILEFKGRLPKYKNPRRYPGDLKPKRPVNLRLTGDFMRSLKHKLLRLNNGFRISVGYFIKESKKKEKEHREGFKGQPKRPTIPKKDEKFIAKIRTGITKIFRERIKRLTQK